MSPRFPIVLSGVAALVCAGLALAACGVEERSAGTRAGTAKAQASQGGFAFVQLRSEHHWPSLRRPKRSELELWAVFVHYWGGEKEDVARYLDIDLEEPVVSPGSCTLVAQSDVLPLGEWDQDGDELSVELLDAGSVVFSLPGHTELLTGSPYPEVLPNVTGQHYRHAQSTLNEPISTRLVSVYGLGEGDVQAFDLPSIRGPAELRLTNVGGWRPTEGPVVLSRRDPLRLRWQPGETQFDTLVRLSWQRRVGRGPTELVCRPRRGGRMVIPASWLARIPLGRLGTRVHLSVENVSRTEHAGPLPGKVDVRVSQADNLIVQLVR